MPFPKIPARLWRRAGAIITNALNSLLVPLLNPVVSLLVVRLASATLWGEFVNLLIVVQLSAHIIYWGNKDYLLREFSFNPAHIAQQWWRSLATRALLLMGFVIFLVVWGLPLPRLGLVLLWTSAVVWYKSYDVLIVYRKTFTFALFVELTSIALLAGGIWFGQAGLTLDRLILLFALTTGYKGLIFLMRFHTTLRGGTTDNASLINLAFFPAAFSFFLLGFSGMLQSRIDLYTVTYYLSDTEVGQYQVFSTLLIYIQAVANFILLPFVKNIYRMSYHTILKIAGRLFGVGLLLVPLALFATQFVLTYFYEFSFAPAFFIFGGLFALPIYFYSPIIYAHFKANQQTLVLIANFVGAALTLALNLLLLPQLGMLGAVVAIAIVNWLMLGFYGWRARKFSSTSL